MRSSIQRDAVSAILAMVVFTIILGAIFPLAITGVSQIAFNNKANGSQIKSNGKVVGSTLVAQAFTLPVLDMNGKQKVDTDGNDVTVPNPRYFQPRPSQTGYNPAGTYFNNAGPNNVDTRDLLLANAKAYLSLESKYDPELSIGRIPIDAATGSASGVDPHVSEANAAIQAKRVAAVRKLTAAQVNQLIEENTDGRFLGIIGEPGVNVLKLNLALDKESSR